MSSCESLAACCDDAAQEMKSVHWSENGLARMSADQHESVAHTIN